MPDTSKTSPAASRETEKTDPNKQRLDTARDDSVRKDRSKSEAALNRKEAILNIWPDGIPQSRGVWLNKLDGQPTEANDFNGEDWDTGAGLTRPGYLGRFHARGQLKTGVLSWADVEPPGDLMNEPVDQIDLARALRLAENTDKDIDGKNAAGTSTIKEGEEKFTFGASYAGTQGISISEVAGLSAAYVHGKRVAWLDGDTWAFQKGGWSVSSVDVQESRSTTTVGKNHDATVTVGGNSTSTTAAGSLTRKSYGAEFIQTNNTAGLIRNYNIAGMMWTSNSSISNTVINLTGAIGFTLNIAAINASVTVAASIDVFVAAPRLRGQNFAATREVWDHTKLSALVYDNVGISVQGVIQDATRNNAVVTKQYLADHKISALAISQSIAAIKVNIADLQRDFKTSNQRIRKFENQASTGGNQIVRIENSIVNTSTVSSAGDNYVDIYTLTMYG